MVPNEPHTKRHRLWLIITIVTYLVALVVVAVVAFSAGIFLAGPHAGLLPHALEVLVLILGWLSVLVLPIWAAWAVWRRVRDAKTT